MLRHVGECLGISTIEIDHNANRKWPSLSQESNCTAVDDYLGNLSANMHYTLVSLSGLGQFLKTSSNVQNHDQYW